MKQTSICTASPNGEKEEIHMAFPFSVGNSGIQSALDWVAQPPPAQGRDTHVVYFNLFQQSPEPLEYNGSMFFRPQGTEHGPVGVRPGLDGFGSLQVRESVCQA